MALESHQIALESHQMALESHQIALESHQMALESHQIPRIVKWAVSLSMAARIHICALQFSGLHPLALLEKFIIISSVLSRHSSSSKDAFMIQSKHSRVDIPVKLSMLLSLFPTASWHISPLWRIIRLSSRSFIVSRSDIIRQKYDSL